MLRLLLCKLQLSNWKREPWKTVLQLGPANKEGEEKELTCILPAFRVTYVKSYIIIINEEEFKISGISALGLLLRLCSSGKASLCRELMDMLHTSVPKRNFQCPWCHSLSLSKTWGCVGIPALLRSVDSTSLQKSQLLNRYFSTAGQTTSSRNKLLLALDNSFLKKHDLPRIDEAWYMRKTGE